MTDVLGTCASWDDGRLVVRREDGELVTIATADVVSGKPVPPRPSVHRRLDPVEADRLALPGWRPLESEPLGEWVLRASEGFSSRGCSVLSLGDPGIPLTQAVTETQQWYSSRGLRPQAHVHPGSPPDTAFREAGWRAYESTSLMLASASRVLRRLGQTDSAGAGLEVTLTDHVDEAWLATDERSARFGSAARAVLEAGDVVLATVRDPTGAVLSRGRGAFHGDWLGVSSVWTEPSRRGQGLGAVVLRELLEWGAEQGATTTYLQVVESNTVARDLYERRGYELHHRYDYLAPSV